MPISRSSVLSAWSTLRIPLGFSSLCINKLRDGSEIHKKAYIDHLEKFPETIMSCNFYEHDLSYHVSSTLVWTLAQLLASLHNSQKPRSNPSTSICSTTRLITWSNNEIYRSRCKNSTISLYIFALFLRKCSLPIMITRDSLSTSFCSGKNWIIHACYIVSVTRVAKSPDLSWMLKLTRL